MEFSAFEAFDELANASVLHALTNGDVETIVDILQRNGASNPLQLLQFVNRRYDQARSNRSWLHILSEYSSDSHLVIAALLIENKADINARDSSGDTALHCAAARGNTTMLKFICNRADIRLNVANNLGATALHVAIVSNHAECASLLLESGACSTIPLLAAGAPRLSASALDSTPANLISSRHISASHEWHHPKHLVDIEATFMQLFSDPAVCAVTRVCCSSAPLLSEKNKNSASRQAFCRLTNLVGSFSHRNLEIAHIPDIDGMVVDMFQAVEHLRGSVHVSTPEELFRSKRVKLSPPSVLKLITNQPSSNHLATTGVPACPLAWVEHFFELLEQQRHPLADSASKLVISGFPVLQYLDSEIAAAARVVLTCSTLQKLASAFLCMPVLESVSICNADIVSDGNDNVPIDWLPFFLRCLNKTTVATRAVALRFVKKLKINNCKLNPTMYYPSMRFPSGIVEFDFSCNPELGLIGAAYILTAISDPQLVRRISFSRCTLLDNIQNVQESHMSTLDCLRTFTSLEHLDLCFNIFSTLQFARIVAALPASVCALQISGIEFDHDVQGFEFALTDGFCHFGASLNSLLLSFNVNLVTLPPSVSHCVNLNYLDISYCSNLKFIPDEVFVPLLSVLISNHNPSLEDIGLLPGKPLKLSFLDLSCCTSLQTLPDAIYTPSLDTILLSHCSGLKTLAREGAGIANAVNMRCIDLSNCLQLYSLPDQLACGSLSNLDTIIIKGCVNMVYPPYKAMKKTQDIKDYLKAAKDQYPLKRVKVVLLGNGRCGKTSLLRSLAKQELDFDCPSTRGVQVDQYSKILQTQSSRKSVAKFVGASLSAFAPEVSYWDFAGQLEYSATHEFFMSSKQAVYIIVFSVGEHASSQWDQVRYWLNTILGKHSKHNRIIIVGTKVDLLDSQLEGSSSHSVHELRESKLKRYEARMRRAVDSVACHHNLHFTIPILFTTASKKHELWRTMRRELKTQISQCAQDIFDGCEGQLRFPAIHKELLDEVQALAKCYPNKPVISLDDECITPRFKLLHAMRGTPDGRCLQSLDVLSDVGLLVHYNSRGQDYICAAPQYVADIISLLAGVSHRAHAAPHLIPALIFLADPDRICQPVVSEHELRNIIYINSDITRCEEGNISLANQLIDFMCEIRLLSIASAKSLIKDTHFLIPLQLRGRPSFWQDCEVPIDTDATIKAVRYKASRGMITAASFLRLMTECCSDIVHMWGCAFISKLSDDEYIFVRLSEDRSVVDVVTLLYAFESARSDDHMNETLAKLFSILQLSQTASTKVFLCPHCVASNHYMRSGVAHEFYKKQLCGLSDTRLVCSRRHEERTEHIMLGARLHFKGSNKMPLLFPGSRTDCISWAPVSEAGVTDYSQADSAHSEEHGGVVLPNSFFALTQQVEAGSKLDRADLERLLSAFRANALACPVSSCGESIRSLQLQYSVGDCIGPHKITRVLDLKSPLVVVASVASSLYCRSVIVKSSRHELSALQPLVVDAACCIDAPYGYSCIVREIIDECRFVVEFSNEDNQCAWETLDYLHLLSPGTKIYRALPVFSYADNCVVVFEKDACAREHRPRFTLFPGRPSSSMQVAFLTPQACRTDDLASVWAEVEDHWAVMLGDEYPNYEIDSVTLFRNEEREQMFLQELHWLSTAGQARPNPYKPPYAAFRCATDNEDQRALRSGMQRQVLGHFHDFQSKFCLLPSKENDGVNLSVVWWGNRPEAYYSSAQNGFQHLPPGLKIDPGYFGEGFYLTRYPRYSDYYISGCKLMSRDVCGGMLMSFAALGRPYPVTQSPFEFKGGNLVKTKDSLLGEACGAACNCFSDSHSVPNHDCHFASVKYQPVSGKPAMKSFFPCPYRMEPEYDEVVVFKSERVMPAAYVSFKRRPRVLLWLDEAPASADNVRIKCSSIPGYAATAAECARPVSEGVADGDELEVTCVPDAKLPSFTGDAALPILMHEFSTVEAITEFLRSRPEHARYPSSLFRIITNRRLFLGNQGLLHFLDNDASWSQTFPSILVFHQNDSSSLVASALLRPGLAHTSSAEVCCAFASFMGAGGA